MPLFAPAESIATKQGLEPADVYRESFESCSSSSSFLPLSLFLSITERQINLMLTVDPGLRDLYFT